jgi:hypothetical protein
MDGERSASHAWADEAPVPQGLAVAPVQGTLAVSSCCHIWGMLFRFF